MESSNTNYCPNCHVNVDSGLEKCPLCGTKLTDDPDKNTLYPPLPPPEGERVRSFTEELYFYLTLIFIGGSVVLNIIFWRGTGWCLSVAAVLMYAWIFIKFTLFSNVSGGAKIGVNILGIIAVLLSFDYTAGYTGWSLNYGIPIVLIGGLIAIDWYSFIHKSKWKENIAFAIFYVVLGFIPLILYFAKLTDALTPAVLCAIAAGITVLGLLRFTIKYFAEEMGKRFHI